LSCELPHLLLEVVLSSLVIWQAFKNYMRICDMHLCAFPFHSMYGATAPSGPWPPSKRASTRPCFQLFSSILLLLTAVMHHSEPRLPIWFLVFPLVLCCGRFHLKSFFGILSSSILIIWPAHPSLLIFISSTTRVHLLSQKMA